MFKSSLIATIGAALALATAAAPPALAQEGGGFGQAAPPLNNEAQEAVNRQNERTREESGRQGRRNSNSQPAPPTPEQLNAAAQVIATAAGVGCQVTGTTLLGVTAEQHMTYEAICATGPGYILIGSTPPQAVDCVLLAGQADIERSRNPAADVGVQCLMPQNTDVVRVVAAYAREAGVACTVDQGASIGKSSADNLIYEVGCSGTDGLWLEREPTGWKTTECAVVQTQNGTCRFSTAAEQAATLKGRLVGSEAEACEVTEGRYMGANANGSFYEAKCGAGNGVIVRFDPAFAVQQVYPCEVAQRIGGGCRLTIVPDLPVEAPAQP